MRKYFTHDSIVFFAGGIPVALIASRAGADIMFSAVAAVFLLRCLLLRDFAWLWQPHYLALLAFGLLFALLAPLTPAPQKSLVLAFASLRFPLFFIAMTWWVLRDGKDLRYFAWFVGITLLLMGVDVAWQWHNGRSLLGFPTQSGRLTGSMNIPNAGMYIACLWFPVLAVSLWWARTGAQQFAVTALAAALTPWIILSGERSAALVFIIGLFAAAAYLFWKLPRVRARVAGFMAASVAAIAFIATSSAFMQARAELLQRQLLDFGSTFYGQMWQAAWLLWRQHPFSGIGIGGFRRLCPSLWETTSWHGYCDNHPHNHYIELLTAGGPLAVMLFVGFVLLLMKSILKKSPLPLEGGGWCEASGGGDVSKSHPHPPFGHLPPSRGKAEIIFACMVGAFVFAFFPLSVRQGFFSNWGGVLFWFSLSFAASLPALYKSSTTRESA